MSRGLGGVLVKYYESKKSERLLADRSVQKRMVVLRTRRLIEDITQVRHPQPVKDSWKVRGGTLYVTFVPGKKVRAYRKYHLNGGRNVFVDTLSEMSL